MKKLFLIILFLLTVVSASYAESRTPIEISRVIDGDTVEASIGKNYFNIRLIGIDCYESYNVHRAYRQAYENNLKIEEVLKNGNNSKLFLEKLYKNNKKNQAYIDFKGVDKYSRVLGVLYFGDLNVNDEMINNGACMFFNYKE